MARTNTVPFLNASKEKPNVNKTFLKDTSLNKTLLISVRKGFPLLKNLCYIVNTKHVVINKEINIVQYLKRKHSDYMYLLRFATWQDMFNSSQLI